MDKDEMKDEEMAEEWVRTKHNILKDCLSACVRAEHKNEIQAFLAGLKAGRPQWHDLQEDKNNLPDNSRFVWCDYGDGYGKGYYDKDEGGWWIEGHMFYSIIDAWCELPTFDKETEK